MKDWCRGQQQDDDGSWYCPMDPSNAAFDCVQCRAAHDHWEELRGDCERDEGGTKWG